MTRLIYNLVESEVECTPERQQSKLLNTVDQRGSKTKNSTSIFTADCYQLSRVMRKLAFCICENKCAEQLRSNCAADQLLCFRYIANTMPLRGSAVAWWLMPRTPDPEVWGSSPTLVKPCCVLEQGTFAPRKVLVIPRKQWLRPNMTEKLFTGMLRINQRTMPLLPKFKISSLYSFSVTVQPGLCRIWSETGFLVSWLNMQLITLSRSDGPRFVHKCQLFKRFPLQPIQCYVKVETLA